MSVHLIFFFTISPQKDEKFEDWVSGFFVALTELFLSSFIDAAECVIQLEEEAAALHSVICSIVLVIWI